MNNGFYQTDGFVALMLHCDSDNIFFEILINISPCALGLIAPAWFGLGRVAETYI